MSRPIPSIINEIFDNMKKAGEAIAVLTEEDSPYSADIGAEIADSFIKCYSFASMCDYCVDYANALRFIEKNELPRMNVPHLFINNDLNHFVVFAKMRILGGCFNTTGIKYNQWPDDISFDKIFEELHDAVKKVLINTLFDREVCLFRNLLDMESTVVFMDIMKPKIQNEIALRKKNKCYLSIDGNELGPFILEYVETLVKNEKKGIENRLKAYDRFKGFSKDMIRTENESIAYRKTMVNIDIGEKIYGPFLRSSIETMALDDDCIIKIPEENAEENIGDDTEEDIEEDVIDNITESVVQIMGDI